MSTVPLPHRERLEEAIAQVGADVSVDQYLRIAAAIAPRSSISETERSFLLQGSSLTPEDLEETALAVADSQALALRSGSLAKAAAASWTTAEVAERLGRLAPNIRRSAAEGRLYSPFTDPQSRGTRLFPAWQFVPSPRGGQDRYEPLPRLGDVIAALPEAVSPLAVQNVMTTAHEQLGGASPVQWLAAQQDPHAVVDLLVSLDHQ